MKIALPYIYIYVLYTEGGIPPSDHRKKLKLSGGEQRKGLYSTSRLVLHIHFLTHVHILCGSVKTCTDFSNHSFLRLYWRCLCKLLQFCSIVRSSITCTSTNLKIYSLSGNVLSFFFIQVLSPTGTELFQYAGSLFWKCT